MLLGNFLVDLDDNPSEKSKKATNVMGPLMGPLSSRREQLNTESKVSAFQMKPNFAMDGLGNAKDVSYSPTKNPTKDRGKSFEDSGSDSDTRVRNNLYVRSTGKNVKGRENGRMENASELLLDAATHPTLPTEVFNLRSNIFFPLSMFIELILLS